MADKSSFSKQVAVDWTNVPTLSQLTNERQRLTKEGKTPSFAISASEVKPGDYFEHESNLIAEVKNMYSDCGFDTEVILQDPFGHNCPTVACPIGFPTNLRKQFQEMKRYNKWICRIHVEIVRTDDGNRLLSVPHIEVDPGFHAMDHLTDTFLSHNVVRGPVAVEILRWFDIK